MVSPEDKSPAFAAFPSNDPDLVGTELLEAVRAAWPPTPRRVLITGGTGFIGWRLAQVLAACGHRVTIVGRNRYRTPWRRLGIQCVTVDVSKSGEIANAVKEQDFVYHAAGLSKPWGPYSDFERANVHATREVVEACVTAGVCRLIHVSSTAVFFEQRDRVDVVDSQSVTESASCHYAATKIEAERIVEQAAELGLDTFTIRARAVFGPRDPSLLPRILDAAKSGRLKQIGAGKNLVDMTYVDNLVYGLVLAAVNGSKGGVATITNHEPVELWSTIRTILGEIGLNPQLRRVPVGIAKSAARLSEWSHTVRQKCADLFAGTSERHRGEPTLTRYAIGLLAHTQTFAQESSKTQLGYEPLVDMQEGLRRTLAHRDVTDETSTGEQVSLRLFTTGYTPQPAHRIEHKSTAGQWKIQATFGLVEHPTEGLTLFDTGYAMRFFAATRRFPYRAYRWITRVVTEESWDAASVLRRGGIDPEDVRRVIVSHFHGDHIGGLRDFPNADFIASEVAWNNVRGRRGISALKRGFLPDLLPDDFASRLHLVDGFHDPGFGPFPHAHDLFGDGTIRLFPLPGHATGQIGALLNESGGNRKFLVADASWTQKTLYDRLPMTLPFRALAESAKDAAATQQSLMTLHTEFPSVELLPTHCPRVADQYDLIADQVPQVSVATVARPWLP